MEDTKKIANEMLMQVVRPGSAIKPEFKLVEDLQLNSLKMMELVAIIEDEFDLFIPINKAIKIKTVADLYYALEHPEEYALSEDE